MKYIVAAIVVFVVGYTLVNVYFRKPGRGFRPYEDMNSRATTARLLAAGWQKLPVEARRPVEKPAVDDAPAAVTRAAVGLGADLESMFAEKPKLLASIERVVAPAAVPRGSDYYAYFTATLPTQKALIGDLALYRKGNELVLIPSTEPLPGKDLMSRWDDSTYHISIATEKLPTGRYQMRIVAKGPAAAWSFNIK
ncbi:MAG: hypothetical protein PSU94_16790 [Lacunisphaera sp.]|nr:hypothetical protein [Lacunisphaera sp.]